MLRARVGICANFSELSRLPTGGRVQKTQLCVIGSLEGLRSNHAGGSVRGYHELLTSLAA
jgi:hypothetical protein